MPDRDSVVDHVAVIDRELHRRFVFITSRPLEKEKLERFVSKSASRKKKLVSFLPEHLTWLYFKIADEIEAEFDVKVTFCVMDCDWC